MGSSAVVACFFGDGAINRGPFVEGLNWAAVYRLPLLFVCEDNIFSAFTHSRTTTAGAGPLARAEACGVPGLAVDGNDVLAVRAAARALVAQLRAGAGPRFLWCRTYRWSGHVSLDAAPYRPQADLAAAMARDPLRLARAALLAQGVEEAAIAAADGAVDAAVAAARHQARAAPPPPPQAALADVQDQGAPPWP
jgi:pyruvate dehydrogenase E1 component alpha subunit